MNIAISILPGVYYHILCTEPIYQLLLVNIQYYLKHLFIIHRVFVSIIIMQHCMAKYFSYTIKQWNYPSNEDAEVLNRLLKFISAVLEGIIVNM